MNKPKIMAFCMAGGHSVVVQNVGKVPEGWSLVEADVVVPPRGPDDPWEPGIWYAKAGTGCHVLCCPEHPLVEA